MFSLADVGQVWFVVVSKVLLYLIVAVNFDLVELVLVIKLHWLDLSTFSLVWFGPVDMG